MTAVAGAMFVADRFIGLSEDHPPVHASVSSEVSFNNTANINIRVLADSLRQIAPDVLLFWQLSWTTLPKYLNHIQWRLSLVP